MIGVGGTFGVVGYNTNSSFPAIANSGTVGFSGLSSGYGVAGVNVATSGNAVGVYGQSGNYAGYFQGNVGVTRTVNINGDLNVAGSKNFRIDHPLDPANKYLVHSCIESNERLNLYNGVALLDSDGKATVEMPSYFESLNKEFRYQLTAIGAPGPNLYVAQEVDHNQFQIAGGTPGMKVSWQITGVRHDAYAVAHPMQVEVSKTNEERGKYLAPTEFGKPKTLGLNYITPGTASTAFPPKPVIVPKSPFLPAKPSVPLRTTKVQQP